MHCVTKNPVSLLHWEFSYIAVMG